MIMDIRRFKEIMLSETNAPLVAYLYHQGLSQEEIVKELSKEMSYHTKQLLHYASNGNKKGKSDSQKLLSVTQKTKKYITEKGLEGIKEMEQIADSQLEKWCNDIEEDHGNLYNQN